MPPAPAAPPAPPAPPDDDDETAAFSPDIDPDVRVVVVD
jgi:hypothetical protein